MEDLQEKLTAYTQQLEQVGGVLHSCFPGCDARFGVVLTP